MLTTQKSFFFKIVRKIEWAILILEGGLLVILMDYMIFQSYKDVYVNSYWHKKTLEFSACRMLSFDVWS